MKSIVDKPFGLMLLCSGLLGIELFVFYLLIDTGLLQTLLAEDYSFISRAILVIYLVASLHVTAHPAGRRFGTQLVALDRQKIRHQHHVQACYQVTRIAREMKL
jgi:hypothetical protein